MTPVITDQICLALEAEHGAPIKIVDVQTRRVYYVISTEQFETVRTLLGEGDFDPREAYPLIAKSAGEAGWSDPKMDA